MVTGATCTTATGGGRRRLTRTRRARGRGRGRRCPGWSPAHPELGGADGEAGEGRRRRRFGADDDGRAGEEEDDGVDPGLSSSIAGARKKREARRSERRLQMVQGRLQSMAMRRRRPARSQPWQRRLGLGFRGEGEGEGEQGVTGCSFIRQGGPWGEERPRALAIVAAVSSLSPQEEEGGVRPTGGSPSSGISLFPFFRNSSKSFVFN